MLITIKFIPHTNLNTIIKHNHEKFGWGILSCGRGDLELPAHDASAHRHEQLKEVVSKLCVVTLLENDEYEKCPVTVKVDHTDDYEQSGEYVDFGAWTDEQTEIEADEAVVGYDVCRVSVADLKVVDKKEKSVF